MYIYVTDIRPFGDFINELAISTSIALDIETTGLDCFIDEVLLLQVKTKNKIFIFDTRKLGNKLDYLIQLIKDSHVLVLGHNIKFDLKFLKVKTGILLTNVYDTMLVEVFCYQGITEKFISLETILNKYLSISLDKETRKSFIGYTGEITQQQLIYASEDVAYLEKIREIQMKRVEEIKLERVIDLEMRLIPVVVEMELNGIKLDTTKWLNLKVIAEEKAVKLKNEILIKILDKLKETHVIISTLENLNVESPILNIFDSLAIKVKLKRDRKLFVGLREWEKFEDLFRHWFILDSPEQVLNILTKIYGFELESTNAKDLEKLDHEIIKLILEYRAVAKAISSFGDTYIKAIHPKTGRIHPSLNQQIADSGRFSCDNPNMQNIKRESEYRSAFIAEEGWRLIDCDFSQQEYRLAGAITKEPVIIEAYKNNVDMHTVTASKVFDIPLDQVTKEQRDKAKAYNFGILYGAKSYGLAYSLNCSVNEAEKIINSFYSGYPTLARVKRAVEQKVLNNLYSTTLLGRKRFFKKPEGMFSSPKDLAKWRRSLEKEGFNHIIQGTGADITKESLIELFNNNPFGDQFKLILTIHDEILAEVKEEIAEKAKKFMIETMERVEQQYLGEIPAKANAVISDHWEH